MTFESPGALSPSTIPSSGLPRSAPSVGLKSVMATKMRGLTLFLVNSGAHKGFIEVIALSKAGSWFGEITSFVSCKTRHKKPIHPRSLSRDAIVVCYKPWLKVINQLLLITFYLQQLVKLKGNGGPHVACQVFAVSEAPMEFMLAVFVGLSLVLCNDVSLKGMALLDPPIWRC